MLQSEQENVKYMMEVVAKVYGTGHLGVEIYAGPMVVEDVCLLLSDHQHFSKCRKDKSCVKEALPGLVKVHT